MPTKCTNCGAALADGDLFCNECGARVEAIAPPVIVFCEQCGAKNSADDSFCTSCGAQLAVEAREPELKPVSEPSSPPSAPQPTHAVPPTTEPNGGSETPIHMVFAVACATLLALSLAFAVLAPKSTVPQRAVATHSSSRPSPPPVQHQSPASRPTAPPVNERPSQVQPSPSTSTPAPDPAQYQYVPCSGYVQVDTKDGSLLNIRPAPGAVDPIVFQVPDNSKLRVDGWTWDVEHGNSTYWFRVTDHGGCVLGWVSRNFCVETNVDFRGTVPYSSSWTRTETYRGSNVVRKHDPASYPAKYATGHITVTAPNHDLNVRPAPGVVDDVVFIITDKYGCKVNGWSYDQFENAVDRMWLRLTDNHDNILGWVNARYCDTKYVERWDLDAPPRGEHQRETRPASQSSIRPTQTLTKPRRSNSDAQLERDINELMAQIEALEDLNDLSDMLEYLTEDELEALVDMYGDDLAELFDD